MGTFIIPTLLELTPEDLIVMGGEDSSVCVYTKYKGNYIVCEKLSSEQTQSTHKHLLALDNYGHLTAFILNV